MKADNNTTKLEWKNEFFSNQTTITKNNKKIGILESLRFSDTTKLEVQAKKYVFKKKGFLSNEFLIKDSLEKKTIGTIKYELFKTQATLKLDEKFFIWKQNGFWKRSWILTDTKNIICKYSKTSSGGQIEAFNDDYLLILTGLFITNYYLRTFILFLIIILIPIIIRN
jgi:hypothetical protein